MPCPCCVSAIKNEGYYNQCIELISGCSQVTAEFCLISVALRGIVKTPCR